MLYIVGTAIGNIQDTTYRAVTTLTQADIILAEDTRTFQMYYGRVQDLFDIHATKEQMLKSFYKENEFEMLSDVLEHLHAGLDVALVSESGMPVISDPGALLIKQVRLNKLPYTVIPGPTAFTTAAVFSGIPHSQIVFLGFLPKKESEIVKVLNTIKNSGLAKDVLYTCYESPHRYSKTVELIKAHVKPDHFYLARELTKKFEDLVDINASKKLPTSLKGEIVLVFTI